ncbi:hypothetical protein LWI29_027635 [Acer saccharum]|uniref:CCHC-type domain-containing protein n=1 Tax=Acer saccharum TaxID=4024 RepID=A0AA39SXU9_ACESA|nr:hypothetical protein LWI29_027635 [Acer saccharum]
MALLVRKFRKFMRKGAKSSGKYSRDKEVKKSFTPPHERSGHAKSNRKVQCFKCKKLGHYASDCPSGDSKRTRRERLWRLHGVKMMPLVMRRAQVISLLVKKS